MMISDPYSLSQLFLNMSVVGGRDAGSESLATFFFDQLSQATITQAADTTSCVFSHLFS